MPGFAFNTFDPSLIRTNTHHIEFDPSRALSSLALTKPHVALVTGRGLSSGTVAELTPKKILSGDTAELYWGVGSEIAQAMRAFKLNNPKTEVWGVSVDELAAGTAGTVTVTFSGTATAAGTIHLYIDGVYFPTAVASGDAAATVSTAVNAAVQAHAKYGRLPCTTAEATSVLTATMRWKGVEVVDVRLGYRGETLPAGITVVVAAGVAGAGNPDAQEIIDILGDVQYDTVVNPFTDVTNHNAWHAILLSRWGGDVQKEGHLISAYVGTHGAATTHGNARNSKHVTDMACNESPTAPWTWAGAIAGVEAGQTHPARPRQTLPILGVLPAEPSAQWSQNERNQLLFDGMATHTVDAAGQVYIERLITTYQTNALSVADPTFLDITTLRTLAALRYDRNAHVAITFPRYLKQDSGDGPIGLPVVTADTLKADGIAQFRRWAADGWVAGDSIDQFKDEYLVIPDPGNVNRFQELMPPKLMDQFRGLSGMIQFLL